MSIVVSCPNCEKKLAVKDELKGRALICPKCKGRFTVPADDLPVAGDSSADDGGVGFLDDLGPTSAGPARNAGGQTAAASSARPTIGNLARSAGRAKKQADQMKMIYIGGGLATAVLIIILAAFTFNGSGGDGGGKTKDENIRFGLSEKQRKGLFEDMFHAVDVHGPTKVCRDEWRRLGGELKLNDSQISDVLKEGLDNGWDQPAMEATQDQKQKTNRRNWIRVINETGRDPIMSF